MAIFHTHNARMPEGITPPEYDVFLCELMSSSEFKAWSNHGRVFWRYHNWDISVIDARFIPLIDGDMIS